MDMPPPASFPLDSPASTSSSTLIVTTPPLKSSSGGGVQQVVDSAPNPNFHANANPPTTITRRQRPALSLSHFPQFAPPQSPPTRMSEKGFIQPHQSHLPRRSKTQTQVKMKKGTVQYPTESTLFQFDISIKAVHEDKVDDSLQTGDTNVTEPPTSAPLPLALPLSPETPTVMGHHSPSAAAAANGGGGGGATQTPNRLLSLGLSQPEPQKMPVDVGSSVSASASVGMGSRKPMPAPATGPLGRNLPRRRQRTAMAQRPRHVQYPTESTVFQLDLSSKVKTGVEGKLEEKEEEGDRPLQTGDTTMTEPPTSAPLPSSSSPSSPSQETPIANLIPIFHPNVNDDNNSDDANPNHHHPALGLTMSLAAAANATQTPNRLLSLSLSQPQPPKTPFDVGSPVPASAGVGVGVGVRSPMPTPTLATGPLGANLPRRHQRMHRTGGGARSPSPAPLPTPGMSKRHGSSASRTREVTKEDLEQMARAERRKERAERKRRRCVQCVGRGSGVEVGFLDEDEDDEGRDWEESWFGEDGRSDSRERTQPASDEGTAKRRTKAPYVLLKVVGAFSVANANSTSARSSHAPSSGSSSAGSSSESDSDSGSNSVSDINAATSSSNPRTLRLLLPRTRASYIDGTPTLSEAQLQHACAFIDGWLSSPTNGVVKYDSVEKELSRIRVRILTPRWRPEEAMAVAVCYLAAAGSVCASGPGTATEGMMASSEGGNAFPSAREGEEEAVGREARTEAEVVAGAISARLIPHPRAHRSTRPPAIVSPGVNDLKCYDPSALGDVEVDIDVEELSTAPSDLTPPPPPSQLPTPDIYTYSPIHILTMRLLDDDDGGWKGRGALYQARLSLQGHSDADITEDQNLDVVGKDEEDGTEGTEIGGSDADTIESSVEELRGRRHAREGAEYRDESDEKTKRANTLQRAKSSEQAVKRKKKVWLEKEQPWTGLRDEWRGVLSYDGLAKLAAVPVAMEGCVQ